MILLFWAIQRCFIAMKARIFAPQLPATALVECVWTSDSGIWAHGFIENFLNTEEHNCGKIVRS